MMLTTKARYAVMAIVEMACTKNIKPIKLEEVSLKQQIPLNYLEQIFCKLKNAGIVGSIRGPGGGYVLKAKLNEITIAAIIDAVEENLQMTRCSEEVKAGCMPDHTKCKTHDLWFGLGIHIRNYFESISIADVIK
jgi:Rrf2 family transcriptional regulator, iron-sulfur cluster assembly transcription factor